MKKLSTALVMILFAAFTTIASAEAGGKTTMTASWYDCAKPGECSKSKRTASGKKFNPNGLTAAHKTLPFGTKLRVTYKGRSVVVTVNDRGPFVKGRQLDLSRGAARSIGCHGVCVVTVTRL